jgi:serine protease Do
MRIACLLLVCVILSGAATYGVIEFRLQRGDFAAMPLNQVVLGGAGGSNQNSGPFTAPVATTGGGMAAEDIYDMALTQVVRIRTEPQSVTGTGVPGLQMSIPPSSGTGFIISSDGYILTNFHVIESAHVGDVPLMVYLHNGSAYEATVIGFDSGSDVALIKIDAEGLNPVVIGDSENVRVGQRIYTVGNPFGDLVYTMTEGIVSALDRVVTVDSKRIDAFQFDAAVNRGNSGGPVYDSNGDVIGIVSMKIMGDSVEGIGFAIPINDAVVIASELIEHGYITGRPLIGITVNTETVTSGHADFFGWVVGAYVRSVTEDSAGERAGLQVGDIIIGLGDVEIDSRDALLFAMRRYNAGDTTTITVWRNGEEITMTITFDENLTAGQPLRP